MLALGPHARGGRGEGRVPARAAWMCGRPRLMRPSWQFAAFKRQPEAVALLLAHGACNPFVLDRKGRTPAEDTKDELIRQLIQAAQEAVLSGVPTGEMNV